MPVRLTDLATLRRQGRPAGITSVCSAHPVVLRAALRHGKATQSTVLIEATCNQVNHLGGYTGLEPAAFAALVWRLASEEDCPENLIVLGGDHLGPSPWRDRPAEAAMAEAGRMVADYVAAGFRKIHLDASMGCKNEPQALDDETTAGRAAELAMIAEAAAREAGEAMPLYVIGTEVPVPGGADHVLDAITPTSPEAARHSIGVHRRVFADAGLSDAFSRVIALVVQPGVEFGNRNVVAYDRQKAEALKRALDVEPRLVFEAHSTDYQGTERLSELVADGFAILKVGPELTFALREALYALDAIASELVPDYGKRRLFEVMEDVMLQNPEHWHRHYPGSETEQRSMRHESLSDRIRYYWATPGAQAAVGRLFEALKGKRVPAWLFEKHMPAARSFAGSPFKPERVLTARVTETLAAYHAACHTEIGRTS